MSKEFYNKLVDLYAGNELTEELTKELEEAAMADAELSHDMFTLRRTVQTLHNDEGALFTEETFYRILMKMHARGAEPKTNAPEPSYWQYQLPMQG